LALRNRSRLQDDRAPKREAHPRLTTPPTISVTPIAEIQHSRQTRHRTRRAQSPGLSLVFFKPDAFCTTQESGQAAPGVLTCSADQQPCGTSPSLDGEQLFPSHRVSGFLSPNHRHDRLAQLGSLTSNGSSRREVRT